MLLVWRLPAFHRRTLRESAGKRKQEVWKNSQEQEAVLREQVEKIQNGKRGIRGLKASVGQECCISSRGAY